MLRCCFVYDRSQDTGQNAGPQHWMPETVLILKRYEPRAAGRCSMESERVCIEEHWGHSAVVALGAGFGVIVSFHLSVDPL